MTDHIDVFISSTKNDLLPFREVTRDAIIGAGAFPIDMQDFTASNKNALQTCYDKVREAELFIGIYAHRYGFAPPATMSYRDKNGKTRTGDSETSITEWEYRWAIEFGIPVLLYVLDEVDEGGKPIQWAIKYYDGEPDKSRLQKFKDHIRGTHIVPAFFNDSNHLKAQVISALHTEIARLRGIGAPPISMSFAIPDNILSNETVRSQFAPVKLGGRHYVSDPITVENPLLIGVLLDLSRSVLKIINSIPEQSGIPQKNLTDALSMLAEKAIQYCKTPEASRILPRFALFIYGFGFGRFRQSIANMMAKIGFETSRPSTDVIPSSNIRDLFSEVAHQKNLPVTPNASVLYESFSLYKKSLEAQIVDTGLGESLLKDSLILVHQRFIEELPRIHTSNAILLIISDGQSHGSTDRELIKISQAIRELGVYIFSCYISDENATAHKRLYSAPPKNWSTEAKRLFECASVISNTGRVMNSISDMAAESGWEIPEGAKMFVQVNNSKALEEVINILISPLKAD